ncbi:MAG: pyridoxamine 5'-phosphate oxidase family protein [Candidatus Nealsonbacteria bacterium]|nr:pyridoxamine 5'-phosphate oxidase family protein [Candidatus Nealsonbacteria bacterium]
MKLNDYFENAKGIGVLATSNADGEVDVAIYSRPHFLEGSDQELAFIMGDRLSHDNLQSNPHAAYLFLEEGSGYVGKRLFLTKIREETDPEKIAATRRPDLSPQCAATDAEKRHLVYFRVDRTRCLVGSGKEKELASSAPAS